MDQHICIHTPCYISKYHAYILNVYNYNNRERRDEEALITLFSFFFSFTRPLLLSFSHGLIEALAKLVNVCSVLRYLREYIISIDMCVLAVLNINAW